MTKAAPKKIKALTFDEVLEDIKEAGLAWEKLTPQEQADVEASNARILSGRSMPGLVRVRIVK